MPPPPLGGGFLYDSHSGHEPYSGRLALSSKKRAGKM